MICDFWLSWVAVAYVCRFYQDIEFWSDKLLVFTEILGILILKKIGKIVQGRIAKHKLNFGARQHSRLVSTCIAKEERRLKRNISSWQDRQTQIRLMNKEIVYNFCLGRLS